MPAGNDRRSGQTLIAARKLRNLLCSPRFRVRIFQVEAQFPAEG